MSKAAKADIAKKIRAVTKGASPIDRAGLDALLPEQGGRVVHELVYSLLIWEATPSQAAHGLKRLFDAVVDYNELRICMPDEIAGFLGPRYPLVEQRADRLKSALHAIYNTEHEVTLEPLAEMSKRDARAYLDALPGMPPFVAARVVLVALGGHAAPVDQRLRDQLVAAGACDADIDAATLASTLERQVRASESAAFFAAVEAWRDAAPSPRGTTTKRPAAKAPAKKAGGPTKKTTKTTGKAPSKATGKKSSKKAAGRSAKAQSKASPKRKPAAGKARSSGRA